MAGPVKISLSEEEQEDLLMLLEELTETRVYTILVGTYGKKERLLELLERIKRGLRPHKLKEAM